MNNVTLVSYPAAKTNSLLSLTSLRSKYMVPFAAKFRVVDFFIRNALLLEAKHALIFNNVFDDLQFYVDNHPFVAQKKIHIKTITNELMDVDLCYDVFSKIDSSYFVLFTGDTPSLMDFDSLFKKYLSRKTNTVLFKYEEDGIAKMANTVLMTNKKSLMSVLKVIKKENHSAPNIFEMLNNMLIHKGVKNSTYQSKIWHLRNIPEYYDSNMEIFKNRDLFDLIFKDPYLKNGIVSKEVTWVGMYGKVTNSFISEGCFINGTVDNSICFPGAIVSEKAVVKNSIIFPWAAVGKKAKVERTILDEFTDYNRNDMIYNIGDDCIIGSEQTNLKNNDFPRAIFNGITLVGKNCRIPNNVKVGGACFISSAVDASSFERIRTIDDGTSVLGLGSNQEIL